MEIINEQRCFGGVQGVYRHQSEVTATPMPFSVFVPQNNDRERLPILWFLSGLTCTEENFTVKAGAQQFAAKYGLVLVAPDTSPRGAGIAGEDDAYDFGSGAGFYVDATRSPWDANYQMYSYLTRELSALVVDNFPVNPDRQGITGHSMGGHGALTIGLKNSDTYQSVSAFAPICSPMNCPWGEKALSGYLGEDQSAWLEYDTIALIQSGRSSGEILVDQGGSDDFLENQLKPQLLEQACAEYKQPLNLRIQPGYDHSYFFIASFIADHIEFHANRLK